VKRKTRKTRTGVYALERLDQVRVMANPVRLRLLDDLAEDGAVGAEGPRHSPTIILVPARREAWRDV
jgi:hypothetical protein